MKHSYRSAITLMFLLACSESTPRGSDIQDDSFLAARAVALDDSTAERVLELVNAASVDTLDHQVRLDRRAALNIVEHRAGADRIDGSPDDDWYDDLQELDAIAYVGPVAFELMLAYVDDHPPQRPPSVHGFVEATPAAQGILEMANQAALVDLEQSARLGSSAAENIVSYRAGQDQQAGTGDDRLYASLAQLDRVPRVGASVFDRLFAYALAIGHLCPDGSVHGISECSGEAEAILELVNYASLEELDVEVGLDQRAAIHIVDHRAGEDGYAWTGDENPFNSLAELDAVPYVDTDAFSKLLAFVDPEPVDLAELRTRFVFDLRAELTGLYGVFGEDIASAGGNSLRRARRAVTEELVEEVLQTENDSLSHDLEWFVVFRHPDTIFPESDWWWFGVYDRRSGQLEGIYDDIPSLF